MQNHYILTHLSWTSHSAGISQALQLKKGRGCMNKTPLLVEKCVLSSKCFLHVYTIPIMDDKKGAIVWTRTPLPLHTHTHTLDGIMRSVV